jgi:hypothetical protein
MNEPTDLRSAYPGAAFAVNDCEGMVVFWRVARTAGAQPEQCLQAMKDGADKLVAHDPADQGYRLLRDQMNHPDFARYVAVKLGYV